ncbi:MAG: hypothetical protein PHQ34_01685 [Methanothrix sp.]|nr:hypothetical protein [Methanothrix sp.]
MYRKFELYAVAKTKGMDYANQKGADDRQVDKRALFPVPAKKER